MAFLAFFKLIRLPNLLIVALLQYIIRWLVIYPVLKEFGIDFQMSELYFLFMVLATVFLTAGGYVINDYFDRPTDMVNKPAKVIVGRLISRRAAMTLHIVLNSIAVLLGFYISYYIGLMQLGFIYVVVAGLLWYYSTTYKRQFLVGNLIVAILTAIVPLMVVVYEIPLLLKAYPGSDFNYLFYYVAILAYYAFFTTLIREIIKDIEDMEGDNAYDRNTLPIVLGVKYSKLIVVLLIAFTILSMFYIYFSYLEYMVYIEHIYTFWYIIVGLVIPLLFLAYKLIKSKSKIDYNFTSNLTKIIMLLGMFYLVYREVVSYLTM